VLSGDAAARVQASALQEMVITDSIKASPAVEAAGKIRKLSLAPLLAEAISRINSETSVSSLLD
jgi:ribose-phosphate pyrophosphokinase